MRTKLTLACAALAFAVVAGGTAEATGLIHTANIANGAVTFDKFAPSVQKLLVVRAKPGINGSNGQPGATGSTGETGATGMQGPPGATGPKGATGADGAQGVRGPKGDPGLKGDTGATGDTGPQGDPGAPGGKGDTGAKGDPGSDGAPGADSDDIRTVTAADMHGFVFAPNGDDGDTTPNGSVSFDAVTGAPKGANVLDMQTTTGRGVVVYLPVAAGRLLSELTSFGYASNVISAPNPAYDVTAQIEVVGSSATHFGSGYTTVVFEPYLNGNQGAVGWHRNDVVHGKVWSSQALPSGDCSQSVPCPFSTFIAENPKATVLSAPKLRIGQNGGTAATDAGQYQVDDVIYGFGTAVNFDLGG
jgi:hypothetical protein